MYTHDSDIPVRRLQFDHASGVFVESNKKKSFLRGPIPMEWLDKAAGLPGKTLHVAIALWWLHGMSKEKPFKLTRKALGHLHIARDAAHDSLARLEQQGLIAVERKAGQRPLILILDQESAVHQLDASRRNEDSYNIRLTPAASLNALSNSVGS